MRYVRLDGFDQALDISTSTGRQLLDTTRTVNVLACFVADLDVTDVFVCPWLYNFDHDQFGIMKPDADHCNHFHVKIRDPEGDS